MLQRQLTLLLLLWLSTLLGTSSSEVATPDLGELAKRQDEDEGETIGLEDTGLVDRPADEDEDEDSDSDRDRNRDDEDSDPRDEDEEPSDEDEDSNDNERSRDDDDEDDEDDDDIVGLDTPGASNAPPSSPEWLAPALPCEKCATTLIQSGTEYTITWEHDYKTLTNEPDSITLEVSLPNGPGENPQEWELIAEFDAGVEEYEWEAPLSALEGQPYYFRLRDSDNTRPGDFKPGGLFTTMSGPFALYHTQEGDVLPVAGAETQVKVKATSMVMVVVAAVAVILI